MGKAMCDYITTAEEDAFDKDTSDDNRDRGKAAKKICKGRRSVTKRRK